MKTLSKEDCFSYIEVLENKIQELQKENEKLKKDELTGAFNRHYLDEQIKKLYEPELRHKSFWFYNVYLFDLNNLHDINRKEGYEKGDEYIKNFFNYIEKILKNNSISGRIYRIGGDEFILITQPYDKINLSELNNENFEYSHKEWKHPEKFSRVIKLLDAEIIRKKSKKKNFNPCRNCVVNRHPELLELATKILQEKKDNHDKISKKEIK